jgi:hypothetical protein
METATGLGGFEKSIALPVIEPRVFDCPAHSLRTTLTITSMLLKKQNWCEKWFTIAQVMGTLVGSCDEHPVL